MPAGKRALLVSSLPLGVVIDEEGERTVGIAAIVERMISVIFRGPEVGREFDSLEAA